MRGFHIQVRSITTPVWYEDRSDFSERPRPTRADTVSELRNAIISAADSRTLAFTQHVRIVTNDGKPVERWKIRPGRAVRAWRKW